MGRHTSSAANAVAPPRYAVTDTATGITTMRRTRPRRADLLAAKRLKQLLKRNAQEVKHFHLITPPQDLFIETNPTLPHNGAQEMFSWTNGIGFMKVLASAEQVPEGTGVSEMLGREIRITRMRYRMMFRNLGHKDFFRILVVHWPNGRPVVGQPANMTQMTQDLNVVLHYTPWVTQQAAAAGGDGTLRAVSFYVNDSTLDATSRALRAYMSPIDHAAKGEKKFRVLMDKRLHTVDFRKEDYAATGVERNPAVSAADVLTGNLNLTGTDQINDGLTKFVTFDRKFPSGLPSAKRYIAQSDEPSGANMPATGETVLYVLPTNTNLDGNFFDGDNAIFDMVGVFDYTDA